MQPKLSGLIICSSPLATDATCIWTLVLPRSLLGRKTIPITNNMTDVSYYVEMVTGGGTITSITKVTISMSPVDVVEGEERVRQKRVRRE